MKALASKRENTDPDEARLHNANSHLQWLAPAALLLENMMQTTTKKPQGQSAHSSVRFWPKAAVPDIVRAYPKLTLKQELSCAFGARVTFSLHGQRER
jgi:hypothetical protein